MSICTRLFSFLLCLTFSYSAAGQLVINKYDKVELNAYINTLSIDEQNYIYVCTNNGIFKIGNIDDAPVHLLKGKSIKAVDHDRRLGSIATDGKNIYQISTGKSYNMDEEDVTIRDIEIYKTRVYCATNKGVKVLNPSNGKVETFNASNSKLKSDLVNFIHEDKKGILWFGTAMGEVRAEGNRWKLYHEKVNVTDMYENKEGLWFIGDGEMWLVDYYNREYNAGLNAELYAGTLNDFVIDSKGRLYVASDKLVRYDPYKEDITTYSEDAGLLSKKCTSIACDKNDNIWIGTAGTGLYRLVFGDAAVAEFTASILIEKGLSCTESKNAKLKVFVSGGKGPFTYEWSEEGWSGNNPTNVGPGTYSVTVTDAIQNRMENTIELLPPDPIVLSLDKTSRISAPGKRDGSIQISAEGGTGEIKYNWSNGDRGRTLSQVGTGQYTVTVTDENRCSAVATFEVPREKFIPELDIATLEVGKTLRINELYFKADSTFVTEESFDVLQEVLEFLEANESVVVEIGGHTNTIPSHSYCDQLSSERARNVAEFFYNRGISSDRLSYKGYGKRQPITTDESLAGRARNQRVEIKILAI